VFVIWGTLPPSLDPSLNAAALLGGFSVVAVWSSPYRRKARIAATFGHGIFAAALCISGILSMFGDGNDILHDESMGPIGACFFAFPSFLTLFVIWFTARTIDRGVKGQEPLGS
jgi:hypothetical protein